jgi:hypothetical protein
MKKFVYVISLLIVLSMMLMTFSPVVAARPTGTWRSGIACQNLDAVNDSTVVLTFYPEGSGTAAVSYNSTILAGQSKNWVTTSSTSMPNFPSPFTGAGVVSSSTPIACNVNTEIQGATGTTTNPYRSGTSQGFSDSAAAVKLYAPQVMREYYNYNSYVSVQNTGGASVTVNVKYFDASTGNEVTAAAESASIPAQSSKVFYQTDNAALGNFIGAATIEAADGTTKLAAIVNIYNNMASYTAAQLQSYNAVAAGSGTLFVPRFVRKFYGYNSGMSVQNIGTVDTTVTITFNFAGTEYIYTSPTIKQNASLPLYAPNIAEISGVDSLAMGNRAGSAKIVVNAQGGKVVAIINEDNRGGAGIEAWRNGQGSTYNAPALGEETSTIFFAQITRKVINIFSGGFQVMNATGEAGTCTIDYAGVPAAQELNVVLPANSGFLRYAPNVSNLPDGFNAAVSVTCTKPVVGISNFQAVGQNGDSFVQTNGLNR